MTMPRGWSWPLALILALTVGCDAQEIEEERDAQRDAVGSGLLSGPGRAELGPVGGVLRSTDGRLELALPAGALDAVHVVELNASEDAPEGALSGAFVIEPTALELLAPAELIWHVDPAGVPAELPIERVRIARLGADGQWTALQAPTVDREQLEVRGRTEQLGTFALIAGGCFEHAHCEAPLTCGPDATCRLPACAHDGECAPGEACREARCVALAPCQDWRECAVSETCTAGHCTLRASCADDETCGELETCKDGQCVRADACRFDADCPAEHICEHGTCLALDVELPCDEDPQCECSVDADCPDSQHCDERRCVANVTCTADIDCGGGRVCDVGLCVSQ